MNFIQHRCSVCNTIIAPKNYNIGLCDSCRLVYGDRPVHRRCACCGTMLFPGENVALGLCGTCKKIKKEKERYKRANRSLFERIMTSDVGKSIVMGIIIALGLWAMSI